MLPEPEEKQPSLRGPSSPVAETEQDVINRAVEVIGDRDEALRWMGTPPVRALDYATPILAAQSRRRPGGRPHNPDTT